MPRAIYTEAHTSCWLDTAETLRREIGLEPVYWVGKPHFEEAVRESFPSAVFHSRTDAIRGVPPRALSTMAQRPLDGEILGRFSHALLIAGKMMDRLDVQDGFRFEERTRLFHVQLRYWRAVLERFHPDIVVFPVQPHTVYDYVLYELCQAHGIRTCMFQWTIFHDWLYPLDHIDNGYEEIRERYRHLLASGADDVVLPQAVEQYLQRVNGDYRSAVPDYLLEQMPDALRTSLFGDAPQVAGDFGPLAEQVATRRTAKDAPRLPRVRMFVSNPQRACKHVARYVTDRVHRHRRTVLQTRSVVRRRAKQFFRFVEHTLSPRAMGRAISRLARVPRRCVKALRRFYRHHVRMTVRTVSLGDLNRPLKEPSKRIEDSFRGRWGGARLQYLRFTGRRKKRLLLREYLERCTAPEYGVPYIFVALHYQPEQTTSPTGSVFVDQAVMIDMLARLVPSGWKIYVKEHPFQFFSNSIGERSRSIEFYDDLLAYPNVTLVPWSVSPFELIDHARAVATVTGTTGIEAAMRGMPVLVFGYAWYRDCEGVFYTPDTASCRDALARIAAGCSLDRRKVRLYLKAVEQSCFRADLDFGVRIEPVPHEDNVARIAGGIQRVYERGSARMTPVHHEGVFADLQVSPER